MPTDDWSGSEESDLGGDGVTDVPVRPLPLDPKPLSSEAWIASIRSSTDFSSRSTLRQQAVDLENYNRRLFAQFPDDLEIADPLTSLVNVYPGVDAPAWPVLEALPEEAEIPVIDPSKVLAGKDLSPLAVVDRNEFLLNWRIFTENTLQFMDWSNVLAAGGSVLACMMPLPKDKCKKPQDRRKYFRDTYASSDIDLFIYGLDEDAAKAKMEGIYESLIDAIPFEMKAFRTSHAVTIVSQYPFRHIQIVLRLYKGPAEILTGFDVDCCAVGFTGTQVVATRRAAASLLTRTISIDLSRRSPSYESRLIKYADRGFAIQVPGLRRDRVDPQIYERSFDKTQGLARLLLFEAMAGPGGRLGFKEKQRERRLRMPHERAGAYASLHWTRRNDLKSQGPDANDYNAVFIPFGPEWTVNKIAAQAARKDSVINGTFTMAMFRSTRHHQHAMFVGTMTQVLGDCCGKCPPVPEEFREEEKDLYISGKLTFIVDDPGRQQIGSFHPITDDDWAKGAYVPEGMAGLVNAVANDDVDKVAAELDRGLIEVDDRDWVGRTPFLLAVFCNALKTVRLLIDRGAKISACLPDGRNALHLCGEYGYMKLLELLLETNKLKIAEIEEAERRAQEEEEERRAREDEERGEDEDDEEEWIKVVRKKNQSKGKAKVNDGEEEVDEDAPDVFDLEWKDWDFKMTALDFACFHGHAAIVTGLIDAGCSVKERGDLKVPHTFYGLALECADEARGLEVFNVLLHAKSPLLQAVNNKTILHRLASERKFDLLDAVLHAFEPSVVSEALNFKMDSEPSPLAIACDHGVKDVVLKLLKAGAKPNEDDIVQTLVHNHGRYPNRPYYGFGGQTEILAIFFAIVKGHHQTLDVLLAVGKGEVNPIVKFQNIDMTPLDVVCDLIVDAERELRDRKKKTLPEKAVPTPEEVEQLRLLERKLDVGEGPFTISRLRVLKYLDKAEKGTWEHEALRQLAYMKPERVPDAPKIILRTMEEKEVAVSELVKLYEDDSDDFVIDSKYLSEDLNDPRAALAEINRRLGRLRKCESLLRQYGGRRFPEAFPKVYEKKYIKQNYDNVIRRRNEVSGPYAFQPAVEDEEDVNPILLYFSNSMYHKNIHPNVAGRYRNLFEAVWIGDVEKVRALTLKADPGFKEREEKIAKLRQTVRHFTAPPQELVALEAEANCGGALVDCSFQSTNAIGLAMIRGHYELATELVNIAMRQRAWPEVKVVKKGTRAVMNNYSLARVEDDDDEDESLLEVVTPFAAMKEEEEVLNVSPFVSSEVYEGVTSTAAVSNMLLNVADAQNFELTFTFGHSRLLSVLDVAMIKKDLRAVRLAVRMMMSACAQEAAFALASHDAGAKITQAQVDHYRRVIEIKSYFDGFLLFDTNPGEYQENDDPMAANGQILMRILESCLLIDDKDMVDFYLSETMGGLEYWLENRGPAKGPTPNLLSIIVHFGSADMIDYLYRPGHLESLLTRFMERRLRMGGETTELLTEPSMSALSKLFFTVDDLRPILHTAVRRCDVRILQSLAELWGPKRSMERAQAKVSGGTPVHLAVQLKTIPVLEELLKEHFGGIRQLAAVDEQRGWNALHFAVSLQGDDGRKMLRYVLSRCDKPTLFELALVPSKRHCHTALMLASNNGNMIALNALEDLSRSLANIEKLDVIRSLTDAFGITALRQSIRDSNVATLQKNLSRLEPKPLEDLLTERKVMADSPVDVDENAKAGLFKEDFTGMTAYATALQKLRTSLVSSQPFAYRGNHAFGLPTQTSQTSKEVSAPTRVYKIVREALTGHAAPSGEEESRVGMRREVVPLEVAVGATRAAIELLDEPHHSIHNVAPFNPTLPSVGQYRRAMNPASSGRGRRTKENFVKDLLQPNEPDVAGGQGWPVPNAQPAPLPFTFGLPATSTIGVPASGKVPMAIMGAFTPNMSLSGTDFGIHGRNDLAPNNSAFGTHGDGTQPVAAAPPSMALVGETGPDNLGLNSSGTAIPGTSPPSTLLGQRDTPPGSATADPSASFETNNVGAIELTTKDGAKTTADRSGGNASGAADSSGTKGR